MTFDTMEPVYRDDEASDRFVGPWFRGVARTGRDRHFVQRSGRTEPACCRCDQITGLCYQLLDWRPVVWTGNTAERSPITAGIV